MTEVDDIQRNVLSILRRVAPNARIASSAVKMFVLQGASVVAGVNVIQYDEVEDDIVPPVATGPYITY